MTDQIAPDGAIWVCQACGKVAVNKYGFTDVSCVLNAVLCAADTLRYNEGGRVIAAEAWVER